MPRGIRSSHFQGGFIYILYTVPSLKLTAKAPEKMAGPNFWEALFQQSMFLSSIFSGYTGERLTWNLRIHTWKRKIIFQTIIFRFYVNLWWCMLLSGRVDLSPLLRVPDRFSPHRFVAMVAETLVKRLNLESKENTNILPWPQQNLLWKEDKQIISLGPYKVGPIISRVIILHL